MCIILNDTTTTSTLSDDIIKKLSKIKLILSDLDGTLLSSNFTLSNENINSIKSLSNSNIQFTIASGRSDLMCASYMKDCNINLPTISSNGALIRHLYDKNVIYKTTIPSSIAVKIMDFCKKHSLDYMAYTLDKLYFTEYSKRIEKFKNYNKMAISNNTKPIELNFYNNNHKEIAENGILKILLFANSEDSLQNTISLLNTIPEISFVLSEKNALDISCANTSKGQALKSLCEHLNIPLENTCVLGDYTNDIAMMKLAGISFAMANSPDHVKSAATFITDTNDNSGVSKAIEFILSQVNK